jgi:hypothetical protein
VTLADLFWGGMYLVGAIGVICAGHEFVECHRIARDMRRMAKDSAGGRRRG